MKALICLFVLTNTVSAVKAQPVNDSIAITAFVYRLYEAMEKGDTVALKLFFSPTAILQTIQVDKGVIKVVNEKVADFIELVGKEKPGDAYERIIIETVKIDGPLATVWIRYKFYLKRKFSHGGINSFQMVKLKEGWKLQYVIDTRASMDNTSIKPDFNSIEFASNPDKILSPLREQEGLYPYQIPGGPKVFLATRRKDVEAMLTNGAVFKVSPALKNQSYKESPFSIAIPTPAHLLATDDETHKRLREPLEGFFTPKVLETYRAYITREAENILTSWKPGERHDVAPEFSFLIPVKGIAECSGWRGKKNCPNMQLPFNW